jgi:hypothetical protein
MISCQFKFTSQNIITTMSKSFISEIVSGGQTGVDRAALDIALQLNINHGGWCPSGRQAEDGIISSRYNLKEAPKSTNSETIDPDSIYKIRTELNAKDSDGTLIIVNDEPIGGTLYTIEMAKKHNKAYFIFNLIENTKIDVIARWIVENNIHKLNLAGPRESQAVGIYDSAKKVLLKLLKHQLIYQNNFASIEEKKYRP